MKRKPKTCEPKEYVWTLKLDGQYRTWKCLVRETECVTFEAEREREHLKLTNQERSPKIIQLETTADVYGRGTPLRVRNGVPYLQLEGRWQMSETTYRERLDATVKMHRRNSALEAICGVGLLLATGIKTLVTGDMGQWGMLVVFGIFFLFSSVLRMIRLKYELEDLEEKRRAEEEERAAAQSAPEAEEEP